jgi:hypothetical protein
MSAATLLLCFTVGAALLALWTDTRFPGLVPESLERRLIHVGAALLGTQFVAPQAMRLLTDASSSPAVLVAGLLVFFLPALVYTFLTSLWLLRVFAEALARR